MHNPHLHIIAFDCPSPPDYGGVIDVYYKLKSLAQAGLKITLHYFEYNDRKIDELLQDICYKIYAYPRRTGLKGLDPQLPYIISSRQSKTLYTRLKEDKSPILMEGVHSTFILQYPELAQRKLLLRTHNIETEYYQSLASKETSILKRIYLYLEASRLARYEPTGLQAVHHFLHISEKEKSYFSSFYPKAGHTIAKSFIRSTSVECKSGMGDYALFHGNLSISENREVVYYLLQQVFNKINYPLIISGKNPPHSLSQHLPPHVQLIANPDDETMHSLISNAHIHVLPSFQGTGTKLKLMHALFEGRHIIANTIACDDESLHPLIHIENSPDTMISEISRLKEIPFTHEDIEKRKKHLSSYYNDYNASLITQLL